MSRPCLSLPSPYSSVVVNSICMLFSCIASSLPKSFPSMFRLYVRSSTLYREEECEDGIEEEEEEEETPVTESDSDEEEEEGADTVSKETTPRYFRT